jgi:hypothetical protein
MAVVLILYVSLNASKSNSFPVSASKTAAQSRNFSHLERQRAQRNGVEESAEAFSGKRGRKAALQPSPLSTVKRGRVRNLLQAKSKACPEPLKEPEIALITT